MTLGTPLPAKRPRICIISPALASANNGNWRTAQRWADFLSQSFTVQIATQWPAGASDEPPALLIALHARKSAATIAAFAATGHPIVLVLTGTDLYRDIQVDPLAQQSLVLARKLVLLQAAGLTELAAQFQTKSVVIEQSAPRLPPLPPDPDHFDLTLVGHLRDEKDPLTAARAIMRLADPGLRLLQIGHTDQNRCGAAFEALVANEPRIERLGNLPHEQTRRLIRQSRLLLLPSTMEGGANVLIEAIMSGVPALCSRISGSIGILGQDYPGYFPVGDDQALAALIARCRSEPAFMRLLSVHCEKRAPLFMPERERRLVNELVSTTLAGG